MIALDTNVLARYLLKDDPAQYRAAVALLSSRLNERHQRGNYSL